VNVLPERDEHDERELATDPFDRDEAEDVFVGGRVDPSVVEASVDALFERFEEGTPEEVMHADRYPTEAEVVPSPPAFDEFAADVGDRLPERALALAGEAASEDRSEGVSSQIRSSFPF
jgi:hypothetical protein